MYDKRVKLTEEVLTYLKDNFEEKLFQTRIRRDIRIIEAPSFAQSVINYAPKSRGAKDFNVKSFMKKEHKNEKTIDRGGSNPAT